MKKRVRELVAGCKAIGEGLRAVVHWTADLQDTVSKLQSLAELQTKATLVHQHQIAILSERIRLLEEEKAERDRELGIERDQPRPTIN